MSSNSSLPLNFLVGTLSFTLTPQIHRMFLISACWSATSFSFHTGQVSLPCNMLLCTQLLYSLPLIINDISPLESNGINCPYLFHPIWILASTGASASPSHSACHLNSKTYPVTLDLHWHQYLHQCNMQPVLVTWFKQPLQINDFITLDMLLSIPLHFSCTHFWQLVHCLNYQQHLYHRHQIAILQPSGFIHIYSHASILHAMQLIN